MIPPDSASPTLPRGAILFLALAGFGGGFAMRVNDALLPYMARELGISLGTASQAISLYAIAYGIAQLFFGRVGDRFGKYRVVAWATAASALASLACALAPGFGALRAARIAAGAVVAGIIPVAFAWIGDVIPYKQRQTVLARFLIGFILGTTAGVWAGGFAADHDTWRAPYAVLAVLFAAVAAALMVLERRLPPEARERRPGIGMGPSHIAADFAAVLGQPWARAIVLLVFFEGLSLYGPFAFIAAHLHQGLGVSLSAAGAIVMLFGLGGLVFALASHTLVARLGEAGLVRWGGIGMAAALIAIAFVPAWGYAVVACLALGITFYMMHNTLQVNATQMAPDRRGAAVSAFAASFFLGQSAGVISAGSAVAYMGTAPLMVAGAIGLLATASIFAALLRARSQS